MVASTQSHSLIEASWRKGDSWPPVCPSSVPESDHALPDQHDSKGHDHDDRDPYGRTEAAVNGEGEERYAHAEIDCQHPQNDSLKLLSSLTLEVFVHAAGGDSLPANAGTFQVVSAVDPANPQGNDAVVGFDLTDPLCVPELPVAARSGRVTLEKLSPPSGSVDATLPTGDHFSGSFAAVKCDPPPGPGAGGVCF